MTDDSAIEQLAVKKELQGLVAGEQEVSRLRCILTEHYCDDWEERLTDHLTATFGMHRAKCLEVCEKAIAVAADEKSSFSMARDSVKVGIVPWRRMKAPFPGG